MAKPIRIGDIEHSHDSKPEEVSKLSIASQAVHADDVLNGNSTDVAPALHVSTTFRYSNNPDELIPESKRKPDDPREGYVYSRVTSPNVARLEAILSSLLKGPTLTYSSGLSAFHALLTFLNPARISIGDGYHGCHGVIGIHQKLHSLKKLPLDCPASDLHPGDIIHVETPLNPTGTASNLTYFAEKAHSRGALLTVDATFGPPPLQDPFLWGADIVMHSGTKYIGGHSDMLCGVLAVNPSRSGWVEKLLEERVYLGSVMGSLEGWLGVRSVRTLQVRVTRQAANAEKLVRWLDEALNGKDVEGRSEERKIIREVVASVEHASLQKADLEDGWLKKQMPNGFGPVFAISMKTEAMARRLPSALRLFQHATSLGGVESLIEWRTMSDASVDTRLMRISVGIEDWKDLKNDLLTGFKALASGKGSLNLKSQL